MLTHIHPSRLWFTYRTRPNFNGYGYSGPKSGTDQGPPGAQSPFAHSRRYLLWCDVSHHIRERYPSFIAHTDSCARPNPSRRLQLSLLRQVFAGCHQSLLGDGPSRCYLLNLYMGAWILIPRRLFGASTRFFPKSFGLTLDLRRFGAIELPP